MLASADPTVEGIAQNAGQNAGNPEAAQDATAVASDGATVSPAPPEAATPPAKAEATVPPDSPAPVEGAPAAEGESVIVVNANPRHVRADPLSGINAASFEAITAVDKAVVAPVAGGYEKVVPEPVRNGLRNFLINLAEPIVFLNYLLQFKPGKALETVGRFGINSTIGVAGLFDMARRKPFRLPYRQNGFANTFAYHGVGNGPYLFLPVLGPTTVRDLVGRVLDLSVLPTAIGRPFNKPAYGLGTGIVKAMNDRVAFDEEIVANRQTADPYVATRDFYLKRRQAEVDALHSAAYRARKGIPEPVLPAIPAHVNKNDPAAQPVLSIPSSTGLAPAAPAPAAAVPGTPAVTPAPSPATVPEG